MASAFPPKSSTSSSSPMFSSVPLGESGTGIRTRPRDQPRPRARDGRRSHRHKLAGGGHRLHRAASAERASSRRFSVYLTPLARKFHIDESTYASPAHHCHRGVGGWRRGAHAGRAGRPDDIDAALFVTIHFPPTSASALPRILNRAGRLSAQHATDGEHIETGKIYVAPPDNHLLLFRDTIRLYRGPRENGNRPAVDPMFRSAALAYGPRVVGVILTGSLDDGTSGLLAIKRRGGIAIAQDPEEAIFPSMPQSAIEHVAVDHVVKIERLAALLSDIAKQPLRRTNRWPPTTPKKKCSSAKSIFPESRIPLVIRASSHHSAVLIAAEPCGRCAKAISCDCAAVSATPGLRTRCSHGRPKRWMRRSGRRSARSRRARRSTNRWPTAHARAATRVSPRRSRTMRSSQSTCQSHSRHSRAGEGATTDYPDGPARFAARDAIAEPATGE